jgi:deoxyribose-phosphate aldolase
MDIRDILHRVDHTLLRPNAVWDEIRQACDDAIACAAASVCIPPCFVKRAAGYCEGRMRICTVIGFPNGYSSSPVKLFEAEQAVSDGADELDMVINLSDAASGSYEAVQSEISLIRGACRGKILKVIIETCLLSDGQKVALCGAAERAGADYVKTSTGFSSGGATREDVALLRGCARNIRVKASGGIRTFEFARELIELGADRIGASALVPAALKAKNSGQNR